MTQSHQLKLLVFLAALMCGAWFYSPGTWNAASRYDSIYTLVEEGTFAIDTFITKPKKNVNTGDWAWHNGHYYSSKAPGNMFIGAAAYAPLYWGGRMLGVEHSAKIDLFYGWWINFWCSAVPLALGALCLLLLLLDWGFTNIRAAFWSICFAAATPLFPYSTQLWGHPMAAAFVTIAFYAAWKKQPSHILAGLSIGWAVLADYAAAFALPALALPLLAKRDWRGIMKTILGGIFPLGLFIWYHWVCFGSPVTIANAYANPVFLQSEGAGGMMTRFSTLTVWKLLFGTQRGLIWNAPLLILAFPGALALWKEKRCITIGLAFTILAGLLSNAAYGYWDGGASVTARFLIYSIPAWILFAAHWKTAATGRQLLAIFLALWSFLNMFTVANISPIISTLRYSPLIPDAYWMCYCDGAWNRNRSKGLRLYNWQKETKKFSKEAAISPGRSIFGHAPWSDVILFAGACALLYFTLLRRNLDFASRWKKWKTDGRNAFLRHRHHFRNPWIYAAGAGFILLLLCPGTAVWGKLQHDMIIEPMKSLLVEKWSPGAKPALWFYQLLLSWQASPIVILVLKGIVCAMLTAMASARIARQLRLPAVMAAAVALTFPLWVFYNRALNDAPLLIPSLLFAISGLLGLFNDTPEKALRNLLYCTAASAFAFWDAPGTWPLLLAIPVPVLISPSLRHRFGKAMALAAIPAIVLILLHFGHTANTATAHCFGLEMADLLTPRQFKAAMLIFPGSALLLALTAASELRTAEKRPLIITVLALALMAAAMCFLGRSTAECGHAAALLAVTLFPMLLITVSRSRILSAAYILFPLFFCIFLIINGSASSTRNTPSLAQQWQAAKQISALDDSGHDINIKYRVKKDFLEPDNFEYLMELAYIVRPYDQIKIPRPELDPLLIEIKRDEKTSKLIIETRNPLEALFLRQQK